MGDLLGVSKLVPPTSPTRVLIIASIEFVWLSPMLDPDVQKPHVPPCCLPLSGFGNATAYSQQPKISFHYALAHAEPARSQPEAHTRHVTARHDTQTDGRCGCCFLVCVCGFVEPSTLAVLLAGWWAMRAPVRAAQCTTYI